MPEPSVPPIDSTGGVQSSSTPGAPARALERSASDRSSVAGDGARELADRLPATERILRATVRGLVERGAASLSMQDVADTAGVSKGLIHYHFHDKAALLARVVAWMTDAIVEREASALEGAESGNAVDLLWGWIGGEIERGEVRALQELAHDPAAGVRDAVRQSAVRRRDTAAVTIEALFNALGLRPRVPPTMLAQVFIAFVDGLALQSAVVPELDPRVAFDTFWLTVLSLAE